MSTVSLRSGSGVSCDPYDPSWSPLSLLLPHYSEVTHTLSNSQCSDSKQHPSCGHNASLRGGGGGGGEWLLKPNIEGV